MGGNGETSSSRKRMKSSPSFELEEDRQVVSPSVASQDSPDVAAAPAALLDVAATPAVARGMVTRDTGAILFSGESGERVSDCEFEVFMFYLWDEGIKIANPKSLGSKVNNQAKSKGKKVYDKALTFATKEEKSLLEKRVVATDDRYDEAAAKVKGIVARLKGVLIDHLEKECEKWKGKGKDKVKYTTVKAPCKSGKPIEVERMASKMGTLYKVLEKLQKLENEKDKEKLRQSSLRQSSIEQMWRK
uniref:Uncharacterized protein n=1 Tax=Grammatophora oceanica TaxID=210454 RepID=A0A7S1VNR4_9STRA